jgi:putative hemolysin
MKSFSTLILAFTTLAALPAHALVLNDYSIYNQTQVQNGQPVVFQVKIEATAIVGDVVTLTQTASYMGATIQTADQTASLQAITANEGAFDLCLAYGGTVESLTVAYGTMDTCHIPGANGVENYLGKGIPLGIVKQSSGTADTAVSLELVSFLKN